MLLLFATLLVAPAPRALAREDVPAALQEVRFNQRLDAAVPLEPSSSMFHGEHRRNAADQLGITNAVQARNAERRHTFEGPFIDKAIRDFSHEACAWAAKLEAPATHVRETAGHARTTIRVGQPADEIVAATKDVDLVVMPPRSQGALQRLTFGSVTDEVLRRSPCPVLTVHES